MHKCQRLSGERQVDREPAIVQCRDFWSGWVLVGRKVTGMGGASSEGKAVSLTERGGSVLLFRLVWQLEL